MHIEHIIEFKVVPLYQLMGRFIQDRVRALISVWSAWYERLKLVAGLPATLESVERLLLSGCCCDADEPHNGQHFSDQWTGLLVSLVAVAILGIAIFKFRRRLAKLMVVQLRFDIERTIDTSSPAPLTLYADLGEPFVDTVNQCVPWLQTGSPSCAATESDTSRVRALNNAYIPLGTTSIVNRALGRHGQIAQRREKYDELPQPSRSYDMPLRMPSLSLMTSTVMSMLRDPAQPPFQPLLSSSPIASLAGTVSSDRSIALSIGRAGTNTDEGDVDSLDDRDVSHSSGGLSDVDLESVAGSSVSGVSEWELVPSDENLYDSYTYAIGTPV